MKYKDFGPPVIANVLIGMDWWQWQAHGDSRPREYNIKVAVYRGTTLKRVKTKYPVNAQKEKDYRYVEYRAAIAYLDERIRENVIDEVTKQLTATRQGIVKVLGKKYFCVSDCRITSHAYCSD